MADTKPGPTREFPDELKKYAVRLAQPVFFGPDPRTDYSAPLMSASGCFLLLGGRLLGITCHHVIAAFRIQRQLRAVVFQFGPLRIDPDACLASESPSLDLAVLDVTAHVGASVNGVERAKCIEPTRWPPAEVGSEDVLALAGFLGVWREQVGLNHLRFYSFSSGATSVDANGDRHLVTRIQIEQCILDINHGLVLGSLGGLSGGPVFAWRKTPIVIAELVGVIMEYQETFDLMYIRKASCIDIGGDIIEGAAS